MNRYQTDPACLPGGADPTPSPAAGGTQWTRPDGDRPFVAGGTQPTTGRAGARSRNRRPLAVAATVIAAVVLASCASSGPARSSATSTTTTPASTSTTLVAPEDTPAPPAPTPDEARPWPLPKLGDPELPTGTELGDRNDVAGDWVTAMSTYGPTIDPDDRRSTVDALSTSPDAAVVHGFAPDDSDTAQTARLVDAVDLAPSGNGTVVAVVVDVGPPGQRPAITRTWKILVVKDGASWLVDGVVQ